MTPERFSIFIVVAATGYTLWLADLGLGNIAFVNLRGSYLAGTRNEQAARQATAVILFYALLAVAAALICFLVTLALPSSTLLGAFELALFLLYIALNLAWSSLRNISIAVDLFLFYERLELVRRVAVIATMLAMLGGLPLGAFLIVSNILWGAVFAIAAAKLAQRGALASRLHGMPREFVTFIVANRRSIARSATGALSGVFIVTFPYYVVPLWFGLGAAPIILEVTFRIFRGSSVIFAAICDLAIAGADARAGGAGCQPPGGHDAVGGGAVLRAGRDCLCLADRRRRPAVCVPAANGSHYSSRHHANSRCAAPRQHPADRRRRPCCNSPASSAASPITAPPSPPR